MKTVGAFVIIFILILAIRNISLSILRLQGERARIENLTQELYDKKKEHEFLREQLFYVTSNEFVEIQAREKLGMVKKDEYLVVVSQSTAAGMLSKSFSKEERSNWQKWWSLFF